MQGTLADAQGTAITSAENASVEFTSPLNPGTSINTDTSGNYSVALLADQTYNLTLPTAQLTISVRHGYLDYRAIAV